MEKTVKIGFLGLGTVGLGSVNIITDNKSEMEKKTNKKMEVTKALVKDIHKERSIPKNITLTTNPNEILEDPEITIVVEVMGGTTLAKEYIETALKNKKYVVTANKDLMAQHGTSLLKLAQKNNVNIYYEASVGGGIPLIRPLKYSLASNRIKSLIGIINGTTNFILTQMTKFEKEFTDALYEAQQKGFAEQDPSSDLEGMDAAYKLAILSTLAFQSTIDIEDVYTESILEVSLRDIKYAEELGFAIKLLAIGEETEEGLSLRVHPTLVPLNHPLASVNNEFNALYLEGDAVGEVMFYGRGAGSMPTGSSVVADIIDVVRNLDNPAHNNLLETCYPKKPIKSLKDKVSRFYLRLKAKDRPGVFASLASAFGDEEISLNMIIQKRNEGDIAEIVLVTHDVTEAQFYRAIEKIKAAGFIRNISNILRVLEEGS